jgi:hypothetical protein
MKRIIVLSSIILFVIIGNCIASSINRITLSELQEKADLIVLAKVINLEQDGNLDIVTISVDSYLKGNNPQKDYSFTLVTRGGLKDFDPSLKKGDTGVFFLKLKKMKEGVEKAYWGSVAVFPKNHFDLKNIPNIYTFYKTYTINVPYNNYIIISMRGFGPDNYLVLDMNACEMRIYSPYDYAGLLLKRKLTQKESHSILAIFESEEYLDVPETNHKIACDAEQIDIISVINKRKKHINHIMTDTKIIKLIIDLYHELNVIGNK